MNPINNKDEKDDQANSDLNQDHQDKSQSTSEGDTKKPKKRGISFWVFTFILIIILIKNIVLYVL